MQPFQYASPGTLKEALALLGSEWGEADVLAGGTDLLALMKDSIHTPVRVINIKNIAELGGVRKTSDGLRIGATVTFQELIDNPLVHAEYPALVAAGGGAVASPQIRNMGTVGGDLCQRPRCWYFRNGFGLLAEKDGHSLVPQGENRYHAILGNRGPAYFVSASSLGPPLIALGATLTVVSAAGTREVEAAKFFVTPDKATAREIALAPNEILTRIVIPPATGARNATYEVRQKESLDWPLATASVVVGMKGGSIASARVVLGHVAPTPWVAGKAAEFLIGKSPTEAVADPGGTGGARECDTFALRECLQSTTGESGREAGAAGKFSEKDKYGSFFELNSNGNNAMRQAKV